MEPYPQQDDGGGYHMFKHIVDLLTTSGSPFYLIYHPPARTSEESAKMRATPLYWGAKTMLVQGKSDKYLLVYRACHRVAWNKIRKLECIGKKGKMCEEKEVVKLGLLPGAVPPFPALIGVKGIIDSKFKTIERVAFNAGLRTKSIVMDTKDFVWVQFAEYSFTDE